MTRSFILDGGITRERVLLCVRESMSNEESLQAFTEELAKLVTHPLKRTAVLALVGKYVDGRARSIADWTYAALQELVDTGGLGDGDISVPVDKDGGEG